MINNPVSEFHSRPGTFLDRGKRVRPVCFHKLLLFIAQGLDQRFPHAGWTDFEIVQSGVILHDTGVVILAISLRPMEAKSGVTSPSHRLESQGVNAGTGI